MPSYTKKYILSAFPQKGNFESLTHSPCGCQINQETIHMKLLEEYGGWMIILGWFAVVIVLGTVNDICRMMGW